MKSIISLTDRKSYQYDEYISLIHKLFEANMTTGIDHSETMLGHTKMNLARMKRLDKTAALDKELLDALGDTEPQTWVVLSEAWCGDAAQNLPWLAKMAESSKNIDLQIILRDENLDVMDNYLTNNGRSIPKLISINKSGEELFNWGPRPKTLQDYYLNLKATGLDYASVSEKVHLWYAKNKGECLQKEILEILKN